MLVQKKSLEYLSLPWAVQTLISWIKRTYTTQEGLLTTRCIELVDKKKFAVAVLDLEHETYVVHIRSVNSIALPNFSPLDVHPFHRPQIANLIAEEAFMKVFIKYADFADVFSPDLVSKLPEHIGINNYIIKLVNANKFIKLPKSPVQDIQVFLGFAKF